MKCEIKVNSRLMSLLSTGTWHNNEYFLTIDDYSDSDKKLLLWLNIYQIYFNFSGGNMGFKVKAAFEYNNQLRIILNYERSN